MKEENTPSRNLPKETDVPDYVRLLQEAKTGSHSYDAFIELVFENRRKQETSDSKDLSRIDEFLQEHAGISYRDFVEMSKPETIEQNSFGLINRGSIRRALFESRSTLYLESLCDYEEQGGDVQKILDELRYSPVPLLKKSDGPEPTLEAIYRTLKD